MRIVYSKDNGDVIFDLVDETSGSVIRRFRIVKKRLLNGRWLIRVYEVNGDREDLFDEYEVPELRTEDVVRRELIRILNGEFGLNPY
ncbi:hypothetical protein [Vulcanisaeta souniana]|uniref:Uncharacterized protein n=1 Tax=Vulcanisaeta souniana JCM 11219 TaxID=1293586 RepID=A0A830E2J8_9CREN|nr:hypothetical protein [Vulcanisaeta souniana]BDR91057.1 hypothetical protein Vsou_01500 [Vulcanisaeta souniana JCM 11219]GGI80487.1 hypothetical protein GCM10007112_16630 [Vulcanisaeta souniana JCM 11219]